MTTPPSRTGEREREMKRLDSRKILALLITAMLGITGAYADPEQDLILRTGVPATVSIEKNAASFESDTVNVETGRHSGNLKSVFTLQTNGTDEDYDFILSSSLESSGGTVSAYGLSGGNPTLLFGNIANLPSLADVTNAKAAGSSNCNVIAYPINLIVTSPVTAQYKQNYSTYGDCVVVKLNGSKATSIMQMVNASPVAGTYVVGQDTAGTYKAVVTLTAYNKL